MAGLIIISGSSPGYSQLSPRETAPGFALKDIGGKHYELDAMKSRPMIILYFFDVESKPSQEGLLTLDQMTKKYTDADLNIWGITRSPREKVLQFIAQSRIGYPVFLDTSNVSDLYQARFVLPTICILGPELKVLDYIQGGGRSTEIMLARTAESQLQRKKFAIAKAISKDVAKKNPKNLKVKMVQGYAELKEGNLAAAEQTFRKLSRIKGQGEILGKEGLVSVYAQKGQAEEALALAEQIETKAPDRGHVNTVKGDIFYSKGMKKAAKAEWQKAVEKKTAAPFQKAAAYNKLGRLQASVREFQQARELYDQAVAIDPYYIEATANLGSTFEKEGKWDKALDAYQQALALDKDDVFSATLAKRAQGMIALQNDVEKKKRMDSLVERLVERFREQAKALPKEEDTWTSRPLILSFVDFQEKGGLSERDGFSSVLTIQLSDQLNSSGRVQVVERILIERLIEELNLGSSELANPETALKLGKVLAAKIIGTGSLYYLPAGTVLSLRLIDTETSALPKVVTRQFGPGISLSKELNKLNREILKALVQKYPLRGFVVQVSGDRILINLGSKQGVVHGTTFEVLKEQEPIKYKGKSMRSAPKSIAQLRVVQVEPDLCYAQVLNQEGSITRDDKVQEKLEDI
jgi:tetratricopeptide (TPR) repeat protein/peroxiredoxin